MPIVAIIGSADVGRHYEMPLRNADNARAAGEELGRELADRGWHIVVYSGNPDYIERAVVKGFASSGKARPNSILVRGRFGGRDADFGEVSTRSNIFDIRPEASTDWEVSFYRSLLSVDGLVLLGGGRSTFIAGLIALSRRIPLAPITAFGGEAERVWHYFSRERGWATDEDIATMTREWLPESANAVVAALASQNARRGNEQKRSRQAERKFVSRATRGLLFGLALLIGTLATIPWAYAARPGSAQSLTAIVLAPLLAAMCGAIVRSAYDGSQNWIRSTTLGASAGSVAFLLFIAAQLTTTPALLEGDGARRLLFFVIPVSFTAGLTFDAVYTKLRNQNVTDTSALEQGQLP